MNAEDMPALRPAGSGHWSIRKKIVFSVLLSGDRFDASQTEQLRDQSFLLQGDAQAQEVGNNLGAYVGCTSQTSVQASLHGQQHSTNVLPLR
jgi:actin-like ATPase involved in cell morphogenesis